MNMGERLKKLRLNMKKTLKEESEILSVSLNTIYRWEHDLCVPRKSALKKIAEYYGVPFDWLLHGGVEDGNGYADCDVCILSAEQNVEREILRLLKQLSSNNKYKVLGYIQCMCTE